MDAQRPEVLRPQVDPMLNSGTSEDGNTKQQKLVYFTVAIQWHTVVERTSWDLLSVHWPAHKAPSWWQFYPDLHYLGLEIA